MTNFNFVMLDNSCTRVFFLMKTPVKLAICSGRKWIVPLHTIYYSWFLPEQKKIFFNFQLIEVHCKIEGCILLPLRKEESKHLWILKPNSPLKYQKFYQTLEILWMGRWKNIYILFHGWKNSYLPFRLELPYYISALCAGHSKNIYFYIFLVC